MTPVLAIRSLRVSYGRVVALPEIDLELQEGEVLAILGPSGSGKTTLLHSVAGFVEPDRGSILIDGVEVASPGRTIPPERRSVAMMFQHYALWPHLTAWENVAFPLRRQGLSRDEAQAEAVKLMERLGLEDLAVRRPAELSGGQQQRVALARALARKARLFMLDEPTAHLDAALREQVQKEIALRREEAGAAAIYATHDSAEALAVADKVALMRDGVIVQTGSPVDVYNRPVDLWAARLTGAASVVELTVTEIQSGTAKVEVGGGHEVVRVEGVHHPGRYWALLRPEWSSLGGNLPGRVIAVWYRGSHTDYRIETPIGEVDLRRRGTPLYHRGSRIRWSLERAWVIGASEEARREGPSGNPTGSLAQDS